jgi:two-component system phosphate regulon response regulator PhoB
MQATVLLVEDDMAQREMLSYNLEAAGYNVITTDNGEDALILVDENDPDLIILDWMMPRLSGLETCRRLKSNQKTKNIPVLMLSARSEEVDRVRGLDIGADDYVVKPYAVAELMARVKAHLRRTRAATSGHQITFQDIVLDPVSYKVTRNGADIKLGPTEYKLLVTMMETPSRVWTRDNLLDRVWGREIFVDTRTVDVHIGRLRKALCQYGGDDPIRTVRGAGYSLG